MLAVLDEEIPDAAGRGLTVNAVHITGGGVDLVIGHVHSASACGGAVPAGTATAAAMTGPPAAGALAGLTAMARRRRRRPAASAVSS